MPRPAWRNKSLLAKVKHKPDVHRGRKRGWVSWEESRNIVRVAWEEARKAAAQMELNLARHALSSQVPNRRLGKSADQGRGPDYTGHGKGWGVRVCL